MTQNSFSIRRGKENSPEKGNSYGDCKINNFFSFRKNDYVEVIVRNEH